MKSNVHKRKTTGVLLCLAAAAVLFAYGGPVVAQEEGSDTKVVQRALAVLKPTQDHAASGYVEFVSTGEGVEVNIRLDGLNPGKHGLHVHRYGDVSSPDGKSAGGHFNPHGAEHGSPGADKRHVGDLGNVEASALGAVRVTLVDKELSLDPASPNYVVGRAVVVHAGEDDLSSQPSGAAGARAAVGVIGVADPEGSIMRR